MSQKERKLATLENSVKVRVENYDVTMKHTEKSSILPPERCFNCGDEPLDDTAGREKLAAWLRAGARARAAGAQLRPRVESTCAAPAGVSGHDEQAACFAFCLVSLVARVARLCGITQHARTGCCSADT